MSRKPVCLVTGIVMVVGIVSAMSSSEILSKAPTFMKPDFDAAIKDHFAAIANRDIDAFKSHLTLGDTLYTVVQNGHAFKTPAETIGIHEQWFNDPNWTWNGKVVHKVVGEDMAMALVRYSYKPNMETAAFETWLVYVFQLQEGSWRIVHDQNTALDFYAFARAAGIEK